MNKKFTLSLLTINALLSSATYAMESNFPKEEISNNNVTQAQPSETLVERLAQLGKELNVDALKNEFYLASTPEKFFFHEKFIAARLAQIAQLASKNPYKMEGIKQILRELLQTAHDNKNDNAQTKLEQTTKGNKPPSHPACFVRELTTVKRALIKTNLAKISQVLCSSDNKTVFIGTDFVGADNDAIQIWNISNLPNPSLIKSLHNPIKDDEQGHISSLALTADNKTLFSTSTTNNNINIWNVSDLDNAALITTINTSIEGHVALVRCLALSTDNKILCSGSADHTIKIWDIINPRKPKLITTIDGSNHGHTGWVTHLKLSADNKTLFSLSTWDKTIKIWNIADPKKPKLLKTFNFPWESYLDALAISTDATTLFHTYGNAFRIIDISNLNKPKNIHRNVEYGDPTDNSPINYLGLSADNKTLFVGSIANSIKMLNVSDPKKPILLGTKDTLTDAINILALSQDNKLLFYKENDHILKIANFPDLFVPGIANYLTQLPNNSQGILEYFFIKEIINHKKTQIQKGSPHTNPLVITHPLLKELFDQLPNELKCEMIRKKYVTFTKPVYKKTPESVTPPTTANDSQDSSCTIV